MFEFIIDTIKVYAVHFSILVLLVVVTFILIIFLPKPKCYFDTDICRELLLLTDEKHHKTLSDELVPLLENCEFYTIYKDGKLLVDTSKFANAYELFRTIPFIRKITLVKLQPKLKLPNNYGGVFSNTTLRCVLPLKISGALQSGVWVDGETKFYLNEWIIFDNSKSHSMFNKRKKDVTCILILDIDRPENIPLGIAIEDNDLVI